MNDNMNTTTTATTAATTAATMNLNPSTKTIRILVVEPGKRPYPKTIPHTLEELQKTVGGFIQVVYPWDTACGLVCFEEAKLEGAPLNRALRDENGHIYDIVAGTFFICGLGNEDFTDLPDDLMNRYTKLFYDPEVFIRTPNGIAAIPVGAEE